MLVVIALGLVLLGYKFLLASRHRALRAERPDQPPVVRSDRVDRLVQLACLCLGWLFTCAGALFLGLLLYVWLRGLR